jgi:galactoside O-acetyltransferase
MDMTPEEQEVRRRFDTGELYRDYGPGLEALEAARLHAKDVAFDFNSLRPSDVAAREAALEELLGSVGEGTFIEPPLHVAYGKHTYVGKDVYINFGLKIVDDSDVFIGDQVMIGPNVVISTAGHPLHPELRSTNYQFSAPITIEDRAWLGAGAIILPGVTVGRGSVVAAGAVVTANVPPMMIVGGTPARVLRPIRPDDNDFVYQPPRDMQVGHAGSG